MHEASYGSDFVETSFGDIFFTISYVNLPVYTAVFKSHVIVTREKSSGCTLTSLLFIFFISNAKGLKSLPQNIISA